MAEKRPRGSAATHAHDALRDAILRGELLPGTMLSETELAAGLGVSRTPVRAALARLQDEGWVTIYPQRGALVRHLTATEVREAAQVRHALESAGIHRSSPARREGIVERLAGNLEEQERALADRDMATFSVVAAQFHRAFVELADNATMLEIYDRLQDRHRLSILGSADRITGDPHLVLAEHRTLLDHARRGDWTAFATHLAEHQERNHDLEAGLEPSGR